MTEASSLRDLNGRTAVVIGGGSGIGRGIALGLAGEGMRVVVADIDVVSADAVRGELEANGGRAIAGVVDSTDRESLEMLAERAVEEFGAVHVLVNTVGAVVDRPLADATDEDWGWLLELNLMAHVRAVAAFLPFLRAASGRVHIVTTSSLGGLLAPTPAMSRGYHLGLYVTAKHALVAYSEMLRQELASEGIGVSVLCPTRVAGHLEETSARHRPARFGGPTEAAAVDSSEPVELMPNEAVGPLVVRAIRANRFLVITHADAIEPVEDRHRRLLDDAAFFGEGGASGQG